MDTPQKLVDHLFRHQYGRMVAILAKLFGFQDIELAEDIVQDCFIKALTAWKMNGLPDKPEAWLMQAAKNRAIDIIRRKKTESKILDQIAHSGPATISINNLFLDKEIEDAQLQMIFACCHPALKSQDQIALTLNIVSGFNLSEIANALLSNKEVIKKRIQRAKAKLKTLETQLAIPVGQELLERLPAVEKIIYLIFNEGYYSISSADLVRKDLCFEALRLGRILAHHTFIQQPSTFALLGLLFFHGARMDERMSANNEIILFEDQDRSKWNQDMINMGNHYMFKATDAKVFSVYHYQAAIAAEYMKVKDFASTDWKQLEIWYDHLIAMDESPVYQLNKAAVLAYRKAHKVAEKLLNDCLQTFPRQMHYLIFAIRAKNYELQKEYNQAQDELLKALSSTDNEAEKKLIKRRLKHIAGLLGAV